MEVAIPLGTFIVALTAVIVSVISLWWGARREYVRSLEKRIVYLERKLEISEAEVNRLTRQNHELLNEVHELRQRVDRLQT